MRKLKFVSVFVLLAMLVVTATRVAQANSSVEKVRWLTYTDPRYGFSIEYPAEWIVIPRDDRGVGGTVSFRSLDSPFKVEIGLYLAERTLNTPLEDWTDQYDAAANAASGFEPTEIQIKFGTVCPSWQTDCPAQGRCFSANGVQVLSTFRGVRPFGSSGQTATMLIQRSMIIWYPLSGSGKRRPEHYRRPTA